jgi:hypothetical protein
LSVSRRTHFSFSTGSAAYATDPTPLDPSGRELTYHLIGSARLTHEIGRTWTGQLSYRRGVDFHEGFAAPFLSNAAAAALGGLLSRRLSFSTGVNYSFGSVGVRTGNDYSSGSATAQLQYAITRMVAVYSTYFYYQYRFDKLVALDPRFARSLERQGVRVGLTMSLPLFR